MRMLAVAAVVLGTQTACASLGLGRAAADVLLPVPQENKLGKTLAAEVEKKEKLHPNKQLQAYVAAVGAKVARKARDTPKGITYTFKVIDDDKTVNAFALPGGHIYVYSGLLAMLDDEAELADVLGHEIAHVTQRHVAQKLVAQYGIETVLGLALGKNPNALAQIVSQLVEGGALLRFTHAEEEQADEHGLPYAVAAGYDPNGLVRFFQKLVKGEGPKMLTYLSDHPLPSERIVAAKARIAKMRNPPKTTNAAKYQQMKRLI